MSNCPDILRAALLGTALTTLALPAVAEPLGLGRAATPEEIAAWDVNVMPDGTGLPPGEGDVWTGDEVFAEYCASCHGDFAEGRDAWPKLAGGFGSLDKVDPVKTVGSFWPYVSTVWDYVNRSMPFGGAGNLTPDEVYAITAYILYSNDLVDEDFVLSPETWDQVEMPNVDGFIIDDRAEAEYAVWRAEPCMTDCRDAPATINRRASDVGVTPADDGTMVESPMEALLAKYGGTEWGAERVSGSVYMDGRPDEMAAMPEAAETEAVQEANAEPTAPAAAEPEPEAETGPDPVVVAAGEKVFKRCSACHAVGDGARNKSGPQLNGIIGRPVAALEDFRYSKVFTTLGEEGQVWDMDSLTEFLANPRAWAKGTKMSFAGLKSEYDIHAVIVYLEAASD
ncbi:c-type cytochrome [Palleronia caenipelagi]|uniref:C-type cytochrome n=1 Tax=Palleronia caenipelagi TaxID=2489174 RepID=A0A547PLX3_9RHOB|nr:c-type cytochrome [Palleronia caenipelagi]TRD15145.1 c-type cytochrome [Palleronia caenipelagi]